MSTSHSYGHVACPTCRSVYARSIRLAVASEAGEFHCITCGEVFAQWRTQYVPTYTLCEAPANGSKALVSSDRRIGKVNLAGIIAESLEPTTEYDFCLRLQAVST